MPNLNTAYSNTDWQNFIAQLAGTNTEIDNGAFYAPINQRALASGATCNTADTIFFDRWRVVSGSMVWTSKSGFALNGVIKQRFEAISDMLFGTSFPVTICIGGTVYRSTLTWPASNTGTAASVTLGGVTITIGFESLSKTLCGISCTYTPYITLTTSEAITINYIFSKRPSDNFIAELSKCQRFFRRMTSASNLWTHFGFGICISATRAKFIINCSQPMRATPTLAVSAASTFRIEDGVVAKTSATITLDQASPGSSTIYGDVDTGLTVGNAAMLMSSNTLSAYLDLSAEI